LPGVLVVTQHIQVAGDAGGDGDIITWRTVYRRKP
jgi:hypothetical protein